jgi:hypothetical protein
MLDEEKWSRVSGVVDHRWLRSVSDFKTHRPLLQELNEFYESEGNFEVLVNFYEDGVRGWISRRSPTFISNKSNYFI